MDMTMNQLNHSSIDAQATEVAPAHAYIQARIDASRNLVNEGISNRALPKCITPSITKSLNLGRGGVQ